MFTEAEIWTIGRTKNGMAALLRLPLSARCVPIYVEPSEAQVLLASLANARERPPRFPEFILELCRLTSLVPESVEIHRGNEKGVYRSIVNFVGADKRISLDSKTPDALAIAIRASIPIYLDEAISDTDSIGISVTEPNLSFASQITRLQAELSRRVEAEDYEQAAKIRDQIQQMEKKSKNE